MNILHIAWLGSSNYGDDVMAEAVREQINAHTQGLNEWAIWCDQRPPTLPNGSRWIFGRGVIPVPKRLLEKRALKKADMLLVGGGSVLHSFNSCDWKRRGVVEFHGNGKRTAFGIGLGVGPFESKQDEDACVAFLRELDGCAFRDSASYEFARSCALPYVPVLAFDLAATAHAVTALNSRDVMKIEHIGVSVRLPYRVDEEKTTTAYVTLLEKLVATYKKVTLFSFSLDKGETELNYCKQLQRAVRGGGVNIVSYGGDTVLFTKKLIECDFHITTKFHGVVISYLFDIPFTMISYQRKFEDLADDIGLPKEQRFTQANMDVIRIMESIRPFKLKKTDDIRGASLRNFDVIG